MKLATVVPWGRSLAEYRRMFDLSDADLQGYILDCGGGPASFNAELSERGGRVLSCDPLYQFSAEAIAARVQATYATIVAGLHEHRDRFLWNDFATPEDLGAARPANRSRFATVARGLEAIAAQEIRDLGGQAVEPGFAGVSFQGDSRDSSGDSLHRRGYRPAVGTAPLKESLAAALLVLADWQPEQPLLDPCCGSGTILLEAALRSLRIAPGLQRGEFAFERWPDFDAALWQALLQEARAQERADLPAPIWGRDRDPAVLAQARDNAERCGVGDRLQLALGELADFEAPAPSGLLICHPPYGKRLGDAQELAPLYRQLGDVLKQRFTGWKAYILSGNSQLTKQIGLRTSRRFEVYNGSLPCRLLEYELY